MNEIEIKDNIVRAIGAHLDDMEDCRVFVFGRCSFLQDNYFSSLDIGIDSGSIISFSTLRRIKDELSCLPIFRGIYLIDFSRINTDLRDAAILSSERIN